MIAASEMIYAFRQNYDRYDGKKKPSLDIRSQCYHINTAIEKFVENAIKNAETDSIFRESIRMLEKKEVSLELVKKESQYDIYKYPDKHLKTLRRRVVANKDKCGTKEFPIILFQTDDLDHANVNQFWKSDFAWETALGDEGSDGLYVWHNGDFKTEKVIIDYYREHVRFDCPSLADGGKYFSGGETELITTDTYFELDKFSFDKVVQIAVMLATINIGDERDLALRIRNILQTQTRSDT